jgi:putative thioredoxin
MTPSEFIKDVGEVDFEYEVILFSKTLPVLVYFWADWCKPCKEVELILEQAAQESMGGFRLARVDTESNPNLAIRYEVRTLPTLKAFVDEQVSASMIGPQPESRILNFIHNLAAPSKYGFDIEKANGYLMQKMWAKAEAEFRRVLEGEPDSTPALLGLIKSLLPQGHAREALNLLDIFPISREYSSAETMKALAEELVFYHDDAAADADDLLPAYRNSLGLAARGKIPAALDGLMDILRSSRNYRRGRVRLVIVGLLEIMGNDDPLTREYRAEMASILF